MATIISAYLRAATRRSDEPLNIACMPTHEGYESNLALTGHRFWSVVYPGCKNWETRYRPVPENYTIFSNEAMPPEVDFDLVLCQNRAVQFDLMNKFAKNLHCPLICLEHVLPSSHEKLRNALRSKVGDVNVFISEYSMNAWGIDGKVVHHGIDTDHFAPRGQRTNVLLSVVNEWIKRDAECGYNFWQEATNGLPRKPVGHTPGLSEASKNLAEEYSSAAIFVNTSIHSPIPMALLEAMSSGCAVVSTNNCMIPEIIQHGENGLLGGSPAEIRAHCKTLLSNPAEVERLGRAARATILERFSLKSFVESWNRIFEEAIIK